MCIRDRCSDHAPQDKDAKLAPFPSSGPGLSAFDCFLPLLLALPDLLSVSLSHIITKVTTGPSNIIAPSERSLTLNTGLSALPKASLANGAPADLVLLDLTSNEQHRENWTSNGLNSPLIDQNNLHPCTGEDIPLKGAIKWAFVNGQPVAEP